MSGESAVDVLDDEIGQAEQVLARIVDRIDAMWELRIVAARIERSREQPVSFDDLLPACETPRDRAKMLSLFDRIAPGTGPSGLGDEETAGNHLDSAEGLAGVDGKVLS
jgi:hypothetical protein